MFPSISTPAFVLSLGAATLAAPPHHSGGGHSGGGHSVGGELAEGALKGTISALHHYTESKQQQQVPQQYRRSDEEIELRADDDAFLETRHPGAFGHLAMKYGGKLLEEAIPAASSHFQSKHQNNNNNGQGYRRDFEEGDYEQRDFEDGEFEERDYEDGDFEERDYEDGDFEERDDDEMDVLSREVEAHHEIGGWGGIFRQAGEASMKAFGGQAAETKPSPSKLLVSSPEQLHHSEPEQLHHSPPHLSTPFLSSTPSVPHLSRPLFSRQPGGPQFDPALAKHVGNGQGHQSLGGQCLSSADCASGFCAGPHGICARADHPGAPYKAARDDFDEEELLSRNSGEFDELD